MRSNITQMFSLVYYYAYDGYANFLSMQ